MKKVVITTDSGCNPFNTENMIPDYVNRLRDGKQYSDTIKNKNNNIDIIKGKDVLNNFINGEVYKTSAPSVDDFYEKFIEEINKGNDVIHLAMSSKISQASVNSAYAAINMLDNNEHVHLIDTLTGGTGGAIINLYADFLKKQGLSYKELIKELEELKKRVLSTYYVSSVKGFVSSGRAPSTLKFSDKLKLRYRVDINENGKLLPKIPPKRGSINSTSIKYAREIINENNIEEYDPEFLAILKMQLEKIDMDNIVNYIKSFNYFKNIEIGNFYSVISSYGVVDQYGFGLVKKKK